MKRVVLYFIFLLSLVSIHLEAQTFQPFESGEFPDIVPAMHELPNGHFIYLHTLRFPQNIYAALTATDSVISTVKIVDADFNLVSAYEIKSFSVDELYMGFDILFKEDSFLIFGNIISYNHDFRQGFTIELDQELQPIGEINILNIPDTNLTGLYLPQFNHEGNLVIWGRGGGFGGFANALYEFNEANFLVNLVELPLTLENYTQLSDSSYLLQYTLSDVFQTLSADWDSLGVFYEFNYDVTPASFIVNPGGSLLLPNDQWIVTGVLRLRDFEAQAFYKIEHVSIFGPDGSRSTVFEMDHPDRPFWSPGFSNIVGLSEERLYISNGILGDCETFSLPPTNLDCTNYISLHSFNLNGTTNWSQYLGYDASYFPIRMVATQDSGVLLLVYRFKLEDNPSGQEGDTYFLKFDKDGNLTAPVGVEGLSGIQIKKVLVYPNPARSILQYKYQLPNVSQLAIQFFDAAGRLVLSDSLEDRETTIEHLSAGTYFYKIFGSKKLLQTGKILIE